MLTRVKGWLEGLFAGGSVPTLSPNTFLVWEPCTHSHAEVVPGYVKYLLDLGFDVSVLVTPRRYEEGLFSRFEDSRITFNRLPQRAIRRYFAKHGLAQAKGVLITTARKISGGDTYAAERALFAERSAEQKLLLVEHDVKQPADNGSFSPDIITLRRIDYGNAASTVVNPHYFGEVRVTPKNPGTVTFITIGALRGKRRNTRLLVDAVSALHERGIRDFRITLIGRGSLRDVPPAVRQYFDIRGRVDFSGMYAAVEDADFFLPLLDPDNARHDRYITTGTSGTFQLIYGFAKPCLIAARFAGINGFDSANSLVYADNADLAVAMGKAVAMNQESYGRMQLSLQDFAARLYAESLENLRRLTR